MKQFLMASLLVIAATQTFARTVITSQEYVAVFPKLNTKHFSRSVQDVKVVLDYVKKEISVVVQPAWSCGENQICAAVMPRPEVIFNAKITESKNESCGIRSKIATKKDAQSNVTTLKFSSYSTLTCDAHPLNTIINYPASLEITTYKDVESRPRKTRSLLKLAHPNDLSFLDTKLYLTNPRFDNFHTQGHIAIGGKLETSINENTVSLTLNTQIYCPANAQCIEIAPAPIVQHFGIESMTEDRCGAITIKASETEASATEPSAGTKIVHHSLEILDTTKVHCANARYSQSKGTLKTSVSEISFNGPSVKEYTSTFDLSAAN